MGDGVLTLSAATLAVNSDDGRRSVRSEINFKARIASQQLFIVAPWVASVCELKKRQCASFSRGFSKRSLRIERRVIRRDGELVANHSLGMNGFDGRRFFRSMIDGSTKKAGRPTNGFLRVFLPCPHLTDFQEC